MIWLFRAGEVGDLFVGLDLRKMRNAKLMARIPPPGWAPLHKGPADLAADGAQHLPQLCGCASEVACSLRFRNKSVLDAHLRFAHGEHRLVSRAVVANQCLCSVRRGPYSHQAFSRLLGGSFSA